MIEQKRGVIKPKTWPPKPAPPRRQKDIGRLVERHSMTTSSPETFIYENDHGERTVITVRL